MRSVTGLGEKHAAQVTRIEIIDAVDGAFAESSATKQDIIAAAVTSGSRDEVLTLLDRLPARTFGHVRDLWDHLPNVPLGD